jgi:hypothetical protein
MSIAYHDWIKVDDLALKAIQLSLSEADRDVIVGRIASDYMTDVGAIGMLRQRWLETGSIEDVARLYWGSRREPESPRIESLVGQLLLNLAASGIFEVLKEIAKEPAYVTDFLRQRELHAGLLNSVGFATDAWDQLARLWQLHRWKRTGETERVQNVIRIVLAHGTIHVEADEQTRRELKQLRSNLEAVARGIVSQEIEREGALALPQDGRRYEGGAASPGLGQGRPIQWKDAIEGATCYNFVLLVPGSGPIGDEHMLVMSASAVVTTGGPTSHIQVMARGMKRPAVQVDEHTLRDLAAYKHLIVDGTKGRIAGFF